MNLARSGHNRVFGWSLVFLVFKALPLQNGRPWAGRLFSSDLIRCLGKMVIAVLRKSYHIICLMGRTGFSLSLAVGRTRCSLIVAVVDQTIQILWATCEKLGNKVKDNFLGLVNLQKINPPCSRTMDK